MLYRKTALGECWSLFGLIWLLLFWCLENQIQNIFEHTKDNSLIANLPKRFKVW